MKLERLPEYVTVVIATAAGISFALFAGRYAGSGQLALIFMLLAAAAIMAVSVTMRSSIWILIPVTWVFAGQIPELPLPFAVRDLVVGIVFACYCVFIALKIVKVRPSFGLLDLLILVNVAYLLITFIRNPVGVDALGTERVGGRPYFNVFIGVLAYLVLRRAVPRRAELNILPWLVVSSNFFVGVLNLLAYLVPWTAPILGRFYTGITQDAYNSQNVLGGNTSGNQRLNQLSGFGVTTANLLCSIYRPISLLLPIFPVRFVVFMISVVAVAFSGHRSALLYVMLAFGLASYYRGKIRDTLHLGLLGVGMIGILVLAQGRLFELPFAVQRTLSWLPGDWNYAAKSDAAYSTQWRVEMWKIALTDSTYIQSKMFGDGFGFTHWDLGILARAEEALNTGRPSGLSSQEIALRAGNYHSGPISTIKIVGVIGLVFYLSLITATAVHAHRLILRARGTSIFAPVLFFCIPIVYTPFTFTFVFGAFDIGMPATLFAVGLLQAYEKGVNDELSPEAVSHPARIRDPHRSVYAFQGSNASRLRGL